MKLSPEVCFGQRNNRSQFGDDLDYDQNPDNDSDPMDWLKSALYFMTCRHIVSQLLCTVILDLIMSFSGIIEKCHYNNLSMWIFNSSLAAPACIIGRIIFCCCLIQILNTVRLHLRMYTCFKAF